jgi:acyl-CoA thioester hydrolase
MDHCCTLTVRSYELDTYGHVNNANYLNYLEYARLEFLNDTGFPYEEFRRSGAGLYVARIDIRYLRPAFLNDMLTIRTTSLSWGRVKGAVRQLILRGGEEIADARVDFATVNAEGRPAPMPDDVRERWLVTRGV